MTCHSCGRFGWRRCRHRLFLSSQIWFYIVHPHRNSKLTRLWLEKWFITLQADIVFHTFTPVILHLVWWTFAINWQCPKRRFCVSVDEAKYVNKKFQFQDFSFTNPNTIIWSSLFWPNQTWIRGWGTWYLIPAYLLAGGLLPARHWFRLWPCALHYNIDIGILTQVLSFHIIMVFGQ